MAILAIVPGKPNMCLQENLADCVDCGGLPATDSQVSSPPTARGHLGGIRVYTCTVRTLYIYLGISQGTYQSVQTVQTSPEPLPETGSQPIRSIKKIDIRTY